MVLDKLLEGMHRIPLDASETRAMTKEEIDDWYNHEHILIEKGVASSQRVLELILGKSDEMLAAYDGTVLGGFDPKKSEKYEQRLRERCIPCFTRIPEDFPEYIQLLYASINPNSMTSISFGETIERAMLLKGEDKELFLYELRRRFKQSAGDAKDLSTSSFVCKETLPEHPWDDNIMEIYHAKRAFMTHVGRTNAQYQLMSHIIERTGR